MNIRLIAFTDRGFLLAQRLAEALPGAAERGGASGGVRGWRGWPEVVGRGGNGGGCPANSDEVAR